MNSYVWVHGLMCRCTVRKENKSKSLSVKLCVCMSALSIIMCFLYCASIVCASPMNHTFKAANKYHLVCRLIAKLTNILARLLTLSAIQTTEKDWQPVFIGQPGPCSQRNNPFNFSWSFVDTEISVMLCSKNQIYANSSFKLRAYHALG